MTGLIKFGAFYPVNGSYQELIDLKQQMKAQKVPFDTFLFNEMKKTQRQVDIFFTGPELTIYRKAKSAKAKFDREWQQKERAFKKETIAMLRRQPLSLFFPQFDTRRQQFERERPKACPEWETFMGYFSRKLGEWKQAFLQGDKVLQLLKENRFDLKTGKER